MGKKKQDRTEALIQMLGVTGVALSLATILVGLGRPSFIFTGLGFLGATLLALTIFSILRRRR